MAQPAQIAVEEGAQIRDAVFQHSNPIDAHTKGKALIHVGINPASGDHFRMDHARAQNFEPVVAFSNFERAAFPGTTNVDLGRWFSEREMRSAEAQVDTVDLEVRFHEFF